MGIKTCLWLTFFIFMSLGALGAPIWGVVGYIGHYSVGPERQWWGAPLNGLGLRYSFTLVVCTVLGMLFNVHRLRFGRSLLTRHEALVLLFLGIVWSSTLIHPATVGRYEVSGHDHPSIKLTKIVFFALLMTHVATDCRKLDKVLWILAIGALVLGMQAYARPYSSFVKGRLEGVGGADFSDSNRLAGYLAGVLFLLGAQFLRSSWKGKLLAFLAGGFTANTIVLCRTRGAFLGVFMGVALAAVCAPRKYRAKILVGLAIAGTGGLYLTDPQFLGRMSTINRSEEERDSSAESRLEIWTGGVKMLMANPLGVGAGNFYQEIGQYALDHPGRDAHNTFVRCAGELGFPGLIVFSAIVVGAFASLRQAMRRAIALPEEAGTRIMWVAYGTLTGLTAVLTYGMTGTLVYTEYLWWFLALPVCLTRVLDNLEDDLAAEGKFCIDHRLSSE